LIIKNIFKRPHSSISVLSEIKISTTKNNRFPKKIDESRNIKSNLNKNTNNSKKIRTYSASTNAFSDNANQSKYLLRAQTPFTILTNSNNIISSTPVYNETFLSKKSNNRESIIDAADKKRGLYPYDNKISSKKVSKEISRFAINNIIKTQKRDNKIKFFVDQKMKFPSLRGLSMTKNNSQFKVITSGLSTVYFSKNIKDEETLKKFLKIRDENQSGLKRALRWKTLKYLYENHTSKFPKINYSSQYKQDYTKLR